MKKVISILAVAAFMLSVPVIAQEKEKAKTEKKEVAKEEKKSCAKKSSCCAKKSEEKKS